MPQAPKPQVAKHRLVYIHGLGMFGNVHRHPVHDDGSFAERTVCGSWPGRATPTTPVLDATDSPCPTCFKGQLP